METLTWRDLHAAKFGFDAPFNLNLADDQVFSAEKVIRMIPKKRIVAFGLWQGKSVVAKLFFNPRHVRRHIQKELIGVKTLRENKIPTPPLCYNGYSADKRIYVLMFLRIHEAQNLEEIWRNKESIDALLPLLRAVTVELATQHVLGVLQQDMHLKNFLATEKTIFSLDGGKIKHFSYLLPKIPSMNNLALFLSQLGVGTEKYQEKLFRYYAKSRGWLLKKEDKIELFLSIKKWNELRWQRYKKKIFRNSSDFASIQDRRTNAMYDRRYAGLEFFAFLNNPDAVFNHSTAKILKAGRSSTVIKVILDRHELVIKRYNIKSLWHFLRRCLRPTRAAKCWRLAHKFNLFGVATAKPIAFIEKICLGLRGKSYFVMEYVSDKHAGEYFAQHPTQDEKASEMVTRITALLKNLAKLNITQGDLKVTNFLINHHEQPVLIDLDGAAEHVSLSSLRGAWRREIKRFLKNFRDQPSICEKFREELRMTR